MRDLLRIDTLVAFCALLVSMITAAVLSYQTHVVEEQYAAAIWPYLSVDTTNGEREVKISLTNNGLGPALIGSAQLFIDGRAAPAWTTLIDELKQDPAFQSIAQKRLSNSTTSVDGSTTIRPGDSLTLLAVKVPNAIPKAVLYKHRISAEFCYCSLNDRCWTLDTIIGSHKTEHPVRVNACALTASIQA